MALEPGAVTEALSVDVALEPVGADQIVAGAPSAGFFALDERDGREIGVWEMTPGAMSDTEVDEVFVVLTGHATVSFEDGRESIVISPGSVVRLVAGMRTVWTVTETLRKLYIA